MLTLTRAHHVTVLLAAMVGACGLAWRLHGIQRSLWLDEAWVANSVTASTWSGMFYYDSWLQSSPPLFLVLVRATVSLIGIGNAAFRLVPFVAGLLAVVLMAELTRRIGARRFVLPASTMIVLSPLAIEYSQTLKQYSSELAATTAVLLASIVYLERPTIRRFAGLGGTLAVSLATAYVVAFLVPGIVLSVCLARWHRLSPSVRWQDLARGLIVIAIAVAMLSTLYVWFISPNMSPALHAFFFSSQPPRSFSETAVSDTYNLLSQLPIPGRLLEPRVLVLLIGGGLVLSGCAIAGRRFLRGQHRWLHVYALCTTPIAAAFVCHALSWYPLDRRLTLFLLPPAVLLLCVSLHLNAYVLALKFGRRFITPVLDVCLVSATIVAIVMTVRHPIGRAPVEDMVSSVAFLRSSVQPDDALWVHASSAEGFKLYTKILGWRMSPRFGHTGYACCARVMSERSTEGAVRADFAAGIPETFVGRVWLLYTMRTGHWSYLGLDEARVVRAVLHERGCSEKPTPSFHNVGVSLFDCRGAHHSSL